MPSKFGVKSQERGEDAKRRTAGIISETPNPTFTLKVNFALYLSVASSACALSLPVVGAALSRTTLSCSTGKI